MLVLCVFVATKFIHGAWIVILVVPILVLLFKAIHSHYVMVAKQLSTDGLFIPARWWQPFLHNQSSLLVKGLLMFKKGVIVTSVTYHLEQ